jgi:hypothetical protein
VAILTSLKNVAFEVRDPDLVYTKHGIIVIFRNNLNET